MFFILTSQSSPTHMISFFEDSVQKDTENPLKIGPETTIMCDGRCELHSHCATREKFSRPNEWFQEKENDQKKRMRVGAQNSLEAIFF